MEIQKHLPLHSRLEVQASLYDAGNNLVSSRTVTVNDREAGLSKVATELRVKNPHLWNLDEPYLYTLETDILSDGQKIDGSKTRVGLHPHIRRGQRLCPERELDENQRSLSPS